MKLPTLLNIFLLFSFVGLIFSSCSVLYAPMTPNIPLLEGRNELQFEGGISSDGESFKTAYSPVNHLAFQVNGQWGSVHGSRKELTGAIGTYVVSDDFHMEVFGGYSYGDVDFAQSARETDDNPLTNAVGYYRKPYGQVDFGFSSEAKGFYAGLSLRGSDMDFCYTHTNFGRQDLIGTHVYDFIWEPYGFVNIRLYKNLSVSLYAGATLGQQDLLLKDYFVVGTGLRLTLFSKEKTKRGKKHQEPTTN